MGRADIAASTTAQTASAMLEMLWEVVEKDGRVDVLEAALMRRVPALLYVSDRDSALARRNARTRLGLPPQPPLP